MSEFPETVSARVSVVVPVHNRADQLAQLLASFGRLSLPVTDFVVLICDDGSSEDLVGVIQEAREQYGLSIFHLRQERRGPAVARNLGLEAARTEFVAFTDSDCEVTTNWLADLLEEFDDADVGITGGKVMPHRESPLVSQCSNWIMSSPWGGGARDPRSLASMNYYPRAGNMAVRTALARSCGGFPDTRYGEDIGFSHRVLSTGSKAAFAEDAEVQHNERRTLFQILSEAIKKGAARTRLWRSRGAMELIHMVPAIFVVYLLIAPLAAAVFPQLVLFVAIPAIAYAFLLIVAACHAVVCLRSAAAFASAPACMFLMHLGYGLGMMLPLLGGRNSSSSDLPSVPLDTTGRLTFESPPCGTTNDKTTV